MIESIEGKRGFPRQRPPYVAQVGLFGQPTLAHNVETLYWMPEILRQGAEWFASQGKPGHKGLRSYSVSGRVMKPGMVLAPAGTTANELIEKCGGMLEGHKFRSYLPGGASGGILPASMADLSSARMPSSFSRTRTTCGKSPSICSNSSPMNPAASARPAGSAAKRR